MEIHTEEIELFCKIVEKKPMSIQSIHEIIGGENSNYQCMEVDDSFECYQVLRADLINNLQENKHEILAFEDRMTTDCNIIICVIKIGNLTRQQAVLKCLIRMTIMSLEPKVALCRMFEITGKCFLVS